MEIDTKDIKKCDKHNIEMSLLMPLGYTGCWKCYNEQLYIFKNKR